MLLSGGIDSATCLYMEKKRGHNLSTLTFAYMGIAPKELEAARAVRRSAGVREHRVVRLPDLREARDIAGVKFERLPPTYIPMRNAIFYSIAASFAEEIGADYIVGGHNKDDMTVFRDVSPQFFASFEKALWEGSRILSGHGTRIVRPLGSRTKAEVVRLADSMDVPLSVTWSCHRDGSFHCWRCEGCLARLRAFNRAGIADPLRILTSTGKSLKTRRGSVGQIGR
ncbi:MAG: 7-cyano-7-deazaguanine synthase [Nitrososphaerales archaeon]|nr:7-cyano-7-deazaguanine synthase [Nitrososphaerales archaeon]